MQVNLTNVVKKKLNQRSLEVRKDLEAPKDLEIWRDLSLGDLVLEIEIEIEISHGMSTNFFHRTSLASVLAKKAS